jgi:hypothetical protein
MKYTNHKVGIRGIFLELCALHAALAGVAAAQTFGTTVQGTVYTAEGAPASGTLQLSWPAFTTAASQAVAAGRTSVSIGSDGFVSVNLAPNLGASPMGLYYTAVYHLSDGTTSTEYRRSDAAKLLGIFGGAVYQFAAGVVTATIGDPLVERRERQGRGSQDAHDERIRGTGVERAERVEDADERTDGRRQWRAHCGVGAAH